MNRPMWVLAAAWGLMIAHLWLELRHAYQFLWMTDFALAVLFARLVRDQRRVPAGRAPAHALFIGFFGSLLVAMVTRVTQGHSGRPLVLGGVAGAAFVIVQLVAVTRIVAE